MLFILPLSLCMSCEREFNFEGSVSDPKATLNAIINCTEDINEVKVAESVFLFGNQESKLIDNPNLKVKINGQNNDIWFDRNQDKSSYYKYTSALKVEDKIEIIGNTPEHGEFKGADIVPSKPEIVSVATDWFTGATDNLSYLRTYIKIKDNANQRNYYRIIVKSKILLDETMNVEDLEWQLLDIQVDQEIVFSNISGVGSESEDAHLYKIFSDDLFNGKEYTLNVYAQIDQFSSMPEAKHFIRVEIHALSENLYLYLKSLELALAADRFQEPVKIFTNVDGGYGIVGVYNIGIKDIDVEN